MRITGRQLRQIIKEEVSRMMNEEDSAAAGYVPGTGIDGLAKAEAAKLGVPFKQGMYKNLPYTDAARSLVGVNVPEAFKELQRIGGSAATQGSALSEIIYRKGNGPKLAKDLSRVLNLPETGNDGVSESSKLAYLLNILVDGSAADPTPGYGAFGGGASFAQATNEKSLGISDAKVLLGYTFCSGLVETFRNFLTIPFPGAPR